MFISDEEKKMLNGEEGPGIQRSIQMLVTLAEAFDADRLSIAKRVHIHCAVPYDMLVELTEGAKQSKAYATTHAHFDPNTLDPEGCKRIGIPEVYDNYEYIHAGMPPSKLEEIYRRLGYFLTYTCTPFFIGNIAAQGEVISYGGTSGSVIANSLYGAYGNRDSIPVNVATSVTGRFPHAGYAVKENRYAQVLIEPEGLDFNNFTNQDYGAYAYYAGGVAQNKVLAFNEFPESLTIEPFRLIAYPRTPLGSVGLCHVIGITPEAPTLEVAFGGRKPQITAKVGKAEVKQAMDLLNTADSDDVDLVTFGCPHCSIIEIRDIAMLLEGKKASSNVRLLIGVAKAIYDLAEDMGYIDVIKQAGGVFTSCCVGSQNPFNLLGPGLGVRTAAVDSVRAAHYMSRNSLDKIKICYGDTDQCVDAAITGKWRSK